MEVKTFDLNSYKLHLIKSNKSKTCHMEIHFRDKVDKRNINYKSFLCDILTDCSKNYPTRKDVVIKLEELYKATFYGTTSKTGGIINTMFIYDFISPEYITDDNYLKDVLSLPFEMILNPNILNKAFDPLVFGIVKERTASDIRSVTENPTKLSINNALKVMDEDSLTSVSVLGSIDDLENITPSTLYQEYLNMLNNSHCDVYIIGDFEFNSVYKIISKIFKLDTIKTKKLELYVNNKLSKKLVIKDDTSQFVQSNLNIIYNLDEFSKVEKDAYIQVYNYILGSGGLLSKLYRKLREENSLCYGVYSLFLKYDNLLIVQVGLDESNREKAIKLIDDAFKEMVKGEFSDDDLFDAKNNLLLSLQMTLDNNVSLLNNYAFHIYDKLPQVEKRVELIRNVTKEDIIKLAKKVKKNTVYSLKSGGN